MNDHLAFIADVEDPESIVDVKDAYCVLTELHANIRTQAVLVLFECWRSRDACYAEKNPFTVLQFSIEPDKGGKEFFNQHVTDDHISMRKLRNFVLMNNPQLKACAADPNYPATDQTDSE